MRTCVVSLLQKSYFCCLLFGSDTSDKSALENQLQLWCMLCWVVWFQDWPWRKQKQHLCRACIFSSGNYFLTMKHACTAGF